MARPQHPATTRLGLAVREHRSGRGQVATADEAGVHHTTLSHLERGTHHPTADTARKLAAWLGWTVEQVLVAADAPVGKDSRGNS